MRILILVNEFPPGPGGVGTHAYELARHLEKIGHSIVVVCAQQYSTQESIRDFNRSLRFPVHAYPKHKNYALSIFARFVLVYRMLRQHRPEVVIASGSNSVWIASLYRIVLRSFKLVVVAHGGELTFSSSIRRGLTQWGCRVADHIISVSHYTKRYIPGKLACRITVIHNGANHFLFHHRQSQQALKEKYGYSGKHILLTVGSLSERKGQDLVIRALKEVLKQYPNTIYLMAGRSNTLEHFKTIARQESVQNEVFFLGAVDTAQVIDLYNMADVYVLASRHSADGDFEGFGISVIEAALCNVPAVVTRNSGLVEAIEEGVTGFSVPPDDPSALAQALIKLSNSEVRMKMGTRAKERAERRFTWEHVARAYHQVLTRL